jgi:hypothetical protein
VTAGRLPDWLIIGAAKSGTTSLASWLGHHPDVYATPQKELHYFDRELARGEQWYRSMFAAARDDQLAGEATPAYLYLPDVPSQVKALMPDVRLIAILRHPVERAYSHYWHARNWGADVPSFDEVVTLALDGEARWSHLVDRGRYAEQLDRWHGRGLHPKVLLFEDVARDPQGVFADVCDHLGLPHREVEEVGSVLNTSHRRRSPRLRTAMERVRLWERAPGLAQRVDALNTAPVSYPAMDAATRARLLAHYAPDTARLRGLLDRPLEDWDR